MHAILVDEVNQRIGEALFVYHQDMRRPQGTKTLNMEAVSVSETSVTVSVKTLLCTRRLHTICINLSETKILNV